MASFDETQYLNLFDQIKNLENKLELDLIDENHLRGLKAERNHLEILYKKETSQAQYNLDSEEMERFAEICKFLSW